MDWISISSIVVDGVVFLGFLLKYYISRNQDYWEKKGVTTINLPYSNLKGFVDVLMKKKTFLDGDIDRYKALDAPFGGTVDAGVPSLMIKDPELIKQILVKDFDYFVDRRKIKTDNEPIFTMMLTALEGESWKHARSQMSPTFTTNKIRRMFEHFNRIGGKLVEFIKSQPVGSPGSRDVLVKEAMSRYVVDVIGSTAFGMETNSLQEKNSMFYKMSSKTGQFSVLKILKFLLMMAMPWLTTKLGLRFGDNEAMPFFEGILRNALRHREQSGEKREDFLQILIEARNGELQHDESEMDEFEKDAKVKVGDSKEKNLFTDDMIISQCMLFFLAGLETTGSVLGLSVYVLALYQEIQEKLYEEVADVMKPRGGGIDYDDINKLEYMEKFISEVLRRFGGARLERRVTKPYTIPGTNVTLEKDTLVYVPGIALHRDPKIYREPEKFDPERFAPDKKAMINPYTYLPFGQGPRNCIGKRFALMETKVALAYMVYNFSIEPCESTPIPMKLDPITGGRPVVDLKLRFRERSKIVE